MQCTAVSCQTFADMGGGCGLQEATFNSRCNIGEKIRFMRLAFVCFDTSVILLRDLGRECVVISGPLTLWDVYLNVVLWCISMG